MATCSGCAGCRQGPDSVLVCDACSTPSAAYTPFAVYMHTRGTGLGYVPEVRPTPAACVTRERGRRAVSIPACPRCGGEVVRR